MWQDYINATRFSWAAAIVVASLIARFIQKLHYHRRLVKGLPGPPHSYLWGSLRSMGEVLATQPKRAAPQTFPLLLKERHDLPDLFYVDVWPAGPGPIIMIFDSEIMQQLTVKDSMPKHPVVDDFMQSFGGPGNLVSSEGATWKKWRSAFNPGFSASHIQSQVPAMVDECEVFCDILTKYAKNNDLFRMERVATKLTIDVIGKVTLDYALDSQLKPNYLVEAFMQQVKWQAVGAQFNPIELIDWPVRYAAQRYYTWKMDRYIGQRIDERFATREGRGKSRAVIDLALEAYLKDVKGASGDLSKVKQLDAEFRQAAINNLKTFVFAGHDTTSSTICYVFYYLSKNPEMLARIRQELDDVFGADPDAVASRLRQDGRLLNKLEYSMAVIREVLRLQPPASTVRVGQKGFFLRDPQTGEAFPTENCMLWPVDVGLHRSSKNWPDPHVFRPERHLHAASSSNESGKHDDSANFTSNPAWVAFSKGNRNCIGQELAVIETKVIMAMTLRKYDFKAAFDELGKLKGDGSGYPSDTSGIQEQFGDEAYQIQLGTAKPREGMPCRVSLRV